MKSVLRIAVVAIIVSLSGCSTVAYYSQAVRGQASILLSRRSVDDVLAEARLPASQLQKLQLVQEVVAFARNGLGMDVGDSYSSYVDTGRDYVVWNVFAAPEFSLQMKTFCYPIAGCVSYRGYFAEEDAQALTRELQADGYDAFYGGIKAYSTLGWFDDPVLNTFLNMSDVQLAALLFHELAHKQIYLPGNTQFNESFATAVERAALEQWLAQRGEQQAFATYMKSEARRQQVLALIATTRAALQLLYESAPQQGLSERSLRKEKARLFADLRENYGVLSRDWGPGRAFGGWMASDLNNARIGTIADYNAWVPAFTRRLQAAGSFPAFFAATHTLIQLSPRELQATLNQD
ncbi:MAG: aminopeptidase [Pseudomonadales bacterium]|nr:aminopeptidase [Pseudomonadales bacterium]